MTTPKAPYMRRVRRWYCACGKEHLTEALAFACPCYRGAVLVVCQHRDICHNARCEHYAQHELYKCHCDGGFCFRIAKRCGCVPVKRSDS